MKEYGIFSDEGLIEDGFFKEADAYKALVRDYGEEDELEVYEICPEHPEQPKDGCEECDEED